MEMALSIRVLLESEWGCDPLFISRRGEAYSHIDPEILRQTFALPQQVLDAVDAWDELFQEVLDWDDPGGWAWPSQELRTAYVEGGREVIRLLRRHLPSDVVLEYRADGRLVPEFY